VELFELPAAEYKAAVYLLQRADERLQVNAGKSDLAEALQVSPAYAAKLLTALIDKGLIERVRRGRYMVKPQETETGEGLLEWTSSLLQWTSGLPEDEKFAIPVVTNTTNMISRTTKGIPVLTSKEVNKARSAGKEPERKKTVSMYSDEDDELPVYGETRDDAERRRTRKPKRGRKVRRRGTDFGGKPRSEWTTYDAANYFAAKLETSNLRLWSTVNIGEFVTALNIVLSERSDLSIHEIVSAMDKYLSDPIALDKLERDPRPIRHFVRYMKQTPRALPRDDDFEAELIRKTEEYIRRSKERAAK
jgi:hypothetical protein